ncbi:hypothetical protein [Chryseobacterium sp. 6424]|uniref:hypothetical protein n=1 Tax=Chryseobacterium sp. 6424 TaxID=2039166 RepID=UPI0013CF2601|nr:hypothetical protein [Chryseobacterium sp. 6424]
MNRTLAEMKGTLADINRTPTETVGTLAEINRTATEMARTHVPSISAMFYSMITLILIKINI